MEGWHMPNIPDKKRRIYSEPFRTISIRCLRNLRYPHQLDGRCLVWVVGAVVVTKKGD